MQEAINISTVNVGIIGTNCYIVYKENELGTKEAIIFDPGDDAHKIYDMVEELKVKPVAIVLTHGHFDHILATNEVANRYSISIYASKEEKELLADASLNLSASYRRNCVINNAVYLEDNQDIKIAGIGIKAINTPGHTKGSMCYLIKDNNILFSGDMLFRESVGRTDFPTGNDKDIVNSLNNKLMKMDDSIKVYPGHGPDTTIGYERKNNLYVI